MKSFAGLCGIAPLLLLSAWTANAAGADHLQCLKIKDALAKASYTADITPTDTAFAAATGCTIQVPAKLLCVDATKTNVSPAPPGADPGADAQKYLCYKAKCPKDQPTATLTDQFGVHSITVKGTSLVCAPVPVAAAPTCSDNQQNGNETDVDCGGGSCPTCANGLGCTSDTDCTSSNCSGNVCTAPAATCTDTIKNGNETGIDCGGGSCPQCAAGQGCNSASDCLSGLCQSGVCQSLLMNGQACSTNGQCSSSQCVDGVCCNTACTGTCQACTAVKKGSGADGTCGNVVAGADPDSECPVTAQSTCGTDGSCNGTGACELWAFGTTCSPGFCTGNDVTTASQCNGGGSCIAGSSGPCTPYACSGGSCFTSCATTSQCDAGFTCSGGMCQ